ncbi:hypothetical protein [Aurantiacibacter gangjinensis]|uniref:Uncharacterized protein n=1 Tax=Aurantiacibacter gangjinensis TaxID=502682 RepID=A0A0G9MLT3_9SPHN|nr:hypothetical protein [Aurantiacibacter gangjinensis]KLE31681.1 hypothetical protein AAW01_09170 [Aurantiacibacter gangjinensis]
MGLRFENLDEATREAMLQEIDRDAESGNVYVSNYLNHAGERDWVTILRQAAHSGSDETLAAAIRENGYLKDEVQRRKPKGGFTMAKVPYNAHETLGEGEFGRYYARGLCVRAISEGIAELEVYRAKDVREPRQASEEKIGSRIDPEAILDDLRQTQGVEPALGVPPGPNSGLTLRIPN